MQLRERDVFGVIRPRPAERRGDPQRLFVEPPRGSTLDRGVQEPVERGSQAPRSRADAVPASSIASSLEMRKFSKKNGADGQTRTADRRFTNPPSGVHASVSASIRSIYRIRAARSGSAGLGYLRSDLRSAGRPKKERVVVHGADLTPLSFVEPTQCGQGGSQRERAV